MFYAFLFAAAAAGLAYLFIPAFREKVKGWKTMLAALGVSVIGFLQQFDFSKIVAPDKVGYWMLGIGVVMAVLRVITTSPMGKK